jgi:nucleoside-diphosphate-sugar epimerase
MKILVTGGTGFTGCHLVRRLLEKGHKIKVLDNEKGLFYDELEKKGAEIRLGSVVDESVLRSVIPGCDVVYHLAAAFRKINLPQKAYWDINVEGTRRVLQIAQDSGVPKVIYCSTQGVHGHIDNPPGDENSPIEPEDYYQRTKYEGERAAEPFIRNGMDVTILRPTAMYGPEDPGRFVMLYRRIAKGTFPIFGKGKALYHPLYIDNFIDAFELALEKPEAKGQTYLIGDDKYYEIKDIIEEVGRIMDVDLKIKYYPFWPLYAVSSIVEFLYKPLRKNPPLFRRRAHWFIQDRAFKIDKAKRELGYVSKIDLTEGLRRTYEWYKTNGYLEPGSKALV